MTPILVDRALPNHKQMMVVSLDSIGQASKQMVTVVVEEPLMKPNQR